MPTRDRWSTSQQTMTALRAGEHADAHDTVRDAAVTAASATDAESVARLLDVLTIDELRDRVRELERSVPSSWSAKSCNAPVRRSKHNSACVIAEHETALRRSEQRLRAIFDTEPDCVKVMTRRRRASRDQQRRRRHVRSRRASSSSRAAASMQMICPNSPGVWRDARPRDAGRAGADRVRDHRVARHPEVAARRMRRRCDDADSGSTVVVSICRDITRQKRAPWSVHRHRTILQSMSNASPLGLLVVDDRTHEVLHFNPRFCELFRIEHLAGELTRGALSSTELMAACARVLVDAAGVAASCATLSDTAGRCRPGRTRSPAATIA